MSPRALLLPLLAGVLLAVFGRAAAAEDDTAGMIRFRRVFAPEDRIKDWPLGDGKYLPIDAAEFERLVAAAQARAAGNPIVPTAAVGSARYEAKLVGENLVGQTSANVVLTGASPAMLSLEPCNLAIEKTAWDTTNNLPSPAGSGAGREGGAENNLPSPSGRGAGGEGRVLFGLASDGKLEVLVERSGRLNFRWSLAGRRDSADVLSFTFELPSASANELLIELPNGFTPEVDRGLVTGNEPVGKQARRWRIELGGGHRFHVRLFPVGAASQRPQLALLRESRTYDVSLRGVEVSVRWKLQVHNEPLRRISVLLDPGLQLISARCGDASLPFAAGPAADGEGTRVELTLSEPIRDTERVVRLTAFGPLVADRLWRLPRIRAEGLFWQEGDLTLLTVEPLVADRIVPLGCSQTGTGPLSAPRTGESLQFQSFQPDATIELSLARPAATLQALSATTVELGSDEADARVAADLSAAEGSRFVIAADVAPQWTIDTVESSPAGAVADWTLEPQLGGGQRLAVRLIAALSPTKRLQLVVTARRRFSASLQKLGIDDFSPLRFRDAAAGKRLVALRSAASYALKLSGDQRLHRLRAESLASTEVGLFAEPPQGLLFECDDRAGPLEVSLVAEKPKYTGTVRIEAAIGGGVLRERSLLRCVPEAGRVDRLLVQFFPRRDTAPRWILGGADDRELSVRKWSKSEQAAAGYGDSVETWELTLRRPRSTAFEITAVREVELQNKQPRPVVATSPNGTNNHDSMLGVVTLASLPEAVSQLGTLTIRDVGPSQIHLDNRRLEPILPEPLPSGRPEDVLGAYRYNPAWDVAQGAATVVRVLAEDKPRLIEAWVWDCRLESWFQSNGAARHRASYDLQSPGRGRLRLTLPRGVGREDIRNVWIDGKLAEWQLAGGEASRVTVALPAGQKFPHVAIEWTASGRPLGIVGSLVALLPEPDLLVLARHWTAWLPPGYECLGASPLCGAELTWNRRLFGALGARRASIASTPCRPAIGCR